MALVKCAECEREISDKSKFCPHCGFQSPEQTLQEEKTVLDNEEIFEEKVIPLNDQVTAAVSFWSYPAAKILLVLVIVSLCLSIFSVYTSQKASDLEQNVDYLNERMQLMSLGITASEGIVTDKVVVQKATFYSNLPGEMTGFIDIRPQPSYEYKFLGLGEFNLTDRELRSMLEELMNEVVSFVGPPPNDLALKTIYITANNYDVAEYKDGVIILAGE